MVDLLIFSPACFALNLAFGPNNLLAMNHGAQGGIRFAAAASSARLLVFAPMIAASAMGLGVLLAASATAFNVMKVIGAAYLIWMGFKLLRSRPDPDDIDSARKVPTLRTAFRREGLSAISNPKAILIFAAFFPQFVDVQAYWESYAILGTVFLFLETLAILVYATVGHFAAAFAATRLHWFQRASGIGMLGFGVLLLLSPQPSSTPQ